MVKAGWKTSEFWLTALGTIATTAATIAGVVPVPIALIVAGVAAGVYTVARSAVKIADTMKGGGVPTAADVHAVFGGAQAIKGAIGGTAPAPTRNLSTTGDP